MLGTIVGWVSFLSTPSARRATKIYHAMGLDKEISIHALREEGDCIFFGFGQIDVISIHALREEGDPRSRQSRPPSANFYPRPPRGGRRLLQRRECLLDEISIHALREEGDLLFLLSFSFAVEFLSTPSARRATARCAARLAARTYFYPRPPRGGRRVFSLDNNGQ